MRHKPLASRGVFVMVLLRNFAVVAGLIAASLGIGAVGYHTLAGLPWIDATLNASMILTGMGPVDPLVTPNAKLFGIFYSLFSGVAFLTIVAILLAPAVHRLIHRLHLELYGGDGDGPSAH